MSGYCDGCGNTLCICPVEQPIVDQYADCASCEYNNDEHRTVRVQCDACKEQVDRLVDHLVAAKVERSSIPRGKA